MTGRVQSLIDFYVATGFGNRANLLLRQEQVRSAYLTLTAKEQEELALQTIAEIEKGDNRFEQALCCLACFHPGNLALFHRTLLERRVFYPGVIFFGARSEIAEQTIALRDQENCRDHALEDFMEYSEGIYYAFRCPHCNVTATCYQQT